MKHPRSPSPTVSLYTTRELLVNRPAWEAAMRALLTHRHEHYAVGPLRLLTSSHHERQIAEHLELTNDLPKGANRPPFDDFCVLHVPRAGRATTAAELIEHIQPGHGQTVVVLVIHAARESEPCAWDAAVWNNERKLSPLDSVRISGPGLLKLDRHASSQAIPSDELSRWSRTIGVLGEETFCKLRELSVTLIGAGRNGSLVAMQLATLGIGHLRLVDADVLEPHNLDCSPLLRPRDVGQTKVRAVGKRLMAHRPDLRVSCLPFSITAPEAVTALRALPSDVLITCVDSDVARLAASLLARESLLPHLDVGTNIPRNGNEMHGDCRLLLPGQGCTKCVGGYASEEETLYAIAAPPGVLTRGEPTAWNAQRAGSLVSLNSIVVGAGVQMLLELISGQLRTSFWQRFTWRAGAGLESQGAAVGAGERCGVCGSGK